MVPRVLGVTSVMSRPLTVSNNTRASFLLKSFFSVPLKPVCLQNLLLTSS